MVNEIIERLENIGKQGFTISIVYGPCGNLGVGYSVDILTPDGYSFDLPYAAESFEQCVFIIENEIKNRGWTIN